MVLKNSYAIHLAMRDITKSKQTEKELAIQKEALHYQANYDSLTGLKNRAFFNKKLQKSIDMARKKKFQIALLFIDLDQFKQINDSLGHDIGDEVLKIVANRLKRKIRTNDLLSRLGGDEFTVIMEEIEI